MPAIVAKHQTGLVADRLCHRAARYRQAAASLANRLWWLTRLRPDDERLFSLLRGELGFTETRPSLSVRSCRTLSLRIPLSTLKRSTTLSTLRSTASAGRLALARHCGVLQRVHSDPSRCDRVDGMVGSKGNSVELIHEFMPTEALADPHAHPSAGNCVPGT